MNHKCLIFYILLFPVFTLSQTITSAGSFTVCSGTSVILNTSGNASNPSFQWTLNGADILTAVASSYTATIAGSYGVRVTSNGSFIDYTPVTVVVNPKPDPTFSFNNNNACSGTSIQFTSNVAIGSAPFTYAWNFGDATTSTSQNPTHSFTYHSEN